MSAALIVFGAISAAAGVINTITTLFAHGSIDEKLDTILKQLQELRAEIVTATAEILEAINGVRIEVDRLFALSAMSLADTALFSDAVVFGETEQGQVRALGNAFEAANRLFRALDPAQPTTIVFLSPFLYVVTLRIAVLKGLRPTYYCEAHFQEEFQQYIDRGNGWIQRINDAIAASHTVRVATASRGKPPHQQVRIVATHFRNGVVVDTFMGAWGDDSDETAARVEQQAHAARARGIEQDRRDFGVVDMENTVKAWRDAFHGALRAALVREVLNRPAMAIDFNPDGLMVDGRMLPVGLDLRTTLLELLSSREFRHRIHKAWDAFMQRGDDRLVQFAHRRLFHRDATGDEMALLHGIASHCGYAAFMAVLLHCTEYEERYGRGLPAGGAPLLKAMESAECSRPG
jgi:hypothetical protein